ncbi:hypothetical protein Ga0080574_TMP2294 [Salipiger abyssi]|uniref:Uncharacterized protein n=1 Tax=Salipiger abyssi TaxID=1250539 RepID=A0A1P8UTE4_9RHOB|nr:hypothetical protein Ga0080574_TMP2294 [Salipiger abyssi]
MRSVSRVNLSRTWPPVGVRNQSLREKRKDDFEIRNPCHRWIIRLCASCPKDTELWAILCVATPCS